MAEALATRREQRFALRGLPFRYWEVGSATAEPIVLLHALGACADDWSEAAVALADRWRVIALDQRGHGGSARPGEYAFELMRDDLGAYIDTLGLERPLLVGHSMGGPVAYLFVEASIKSRVLLIGGGSTSHVPRDKLAEVAARVPTGCPLTLEGAGHSVHHTRPTEFIALVCEFLLDQPK